MQSMFIEVAILVLAGIFAGNAAGLAIKEYSLGAIKNTLAGAVGGAAQAVRVTPAPCRRLAHRR